MEKRDWIWVAIRVFGLFLLVRAVEAIPHLVSSSLLTYELWDTRHLPPGSDALAQIQHMTLKTATTGAIDGLAAVLIYGGIGLYLVRNGALVFRWVFPPEKPES